MWCSVVWSDAVQCGAMWPCAAQCGVAWRGVRCCRCDCGSVGVVVAVVVVVTLAVVVAVAEAMAVGVGVALASMKMALQCACTVWPLPALCAHRLHIACALRALRLVEVLHTHENHDLLGAPNAAKPARVTCTWAPTILPSVLLCILYSSGSGVPLRPVHTRCKTFYYWKYWAMCGVGL